MNHPYAIACRDAVLNWKCLRRHLPRKVQAVVSQLRVGACKVLGHYQNKMNRKGEKDVCRRCTEDTPDDTTHFLLHCPSLRHERQALLGSPRDLGILTSSPFMVYEFVGLARTRGADLVALAAAVVSLHLH